MASSVDISHGGARLTIEGECNLPENFTLSFTARGDVRRFCRLAWREGTTFGVAFTDVIGGSSLEEYAE
jgi:hypothetical protein